MERIKSIFKTAGKFLSCIPGAVWVHIVTLTLICIIVGVILAILCDPYLVTVLLSFIWICFICGMLIYFMYNIYHAIFDFIYDFIDEWYGR